MKKLVLGLIILFSFLISFQISAQSFWQQTNGPFGGSLVNDFNYYGDSIIFLATSEGIIKSTDNGTAWERNPNIIKHFYSISHDSIKNLYATAVDGSGNPYLYKSSNGGDDWVMINSNFWANFRNVMINYKDTIIVGSWDKGLYRTFDGGMNWDQINTGLNYLHIHETIKLSNGDLLVCTDGSGVYRTSNWGDNWTDSNAGIPFAGSYRYVYSILEVRPGKILCGTNYGIYLSTNFGNSWVQSSIGYENKRAYDLIKDKNNTIYAATELGGGGVYLSQNEGNSWNYLGLDYSIYTLGCDADSNLCAGGLLYGLNKYSFEDSSWTTIYNRGYTPLETMIITLTPSEYLYAATNNWGINRSTNKGFTWEKTSFVGYANNLLSINDSTLVVGGRYLSVDSGDTWHQISNYEVTSNFYDSTSKVLYIGTIGNGNGPEVYSTSDLGQNWEFINYVGDNCYYSMISSIYKSKITNYIFVTSVCGDPHWGSTYNFYRSTDDGATWEIVYNGYVFDFIENSLGTIYSLSDHGLIVSYNHGSTWISKNISGDCLAIDNLDRIYCCYGGTVRASDAETQNWTTVGNSVNAEINDIVISNSNQTYLATDNGVFIGDLNNFILPVENELEKIIVFSLSQNYPNPFNPSTTISYELPKTGNVSLKVFDVLGKEVATLVNEEKPSGSYNVEFNGYGFASGIYYYQIKAGEFIQTKKMILLK